MTQKKILIDINIKNKSELDYSSYLDFTEKCFVTPRCLLYGLGLQEFQNINL